MYNLVCATSEDSDQPLHPCSLIRVFARRSMAGSQGHNDFYTDSEDSDQTEWMRRLILIFNVKHFLNTLRWTLAEIHR